jgi:hypothetical protein
MRRCWLAVGVLLWTGVLAQAASFRFPEKKHGKGSLQYINGVPVLVVAGKPEEIGEQMGVLAVRPANKAVGLFRAFLKEHGLDVLKPVLVKVGKRILEKYPADYRREFEAVVKAGGVDRDLLLIGNAFNELRVLGGCAGLMIDPRRSKTGGTLLGRNLDFHLLPGMHAYSLVIVYRPESKRPFAVVSVPGAVTAGCAMSAMNADGLVLGGNEIGSTADGSPKLDLKNTPSAVVARRILEGCGTLAEAEKLLRADKPAIRLLLVACDRKGGAVFEATPRTVMVRRAADGVLVGTNRFECKGLATKGTCGRAFVLAQAYRLKKLGVADVAKKMHEVNQKDWTIHTMVFEPATLKLHVAFGDGKKPASAFPLREIDLAKLLKR